MERSRKKIVGKPNQTDISIFLKIPERDHSILAKLINAPEKERKLLVDAFESAGTKLNLKDLTSHIAQKTKADRREVSELLRTLISMYLARERKNVHIDEFTEAVCQAIESTRNPDLKPKDDNWQPFKDVLSRLLSVECPVAIVSKVRYLYSEYQNNYCNARILTDMRPVFGTDPAKEPMGMLLVHLLRIDFHQIDGDKQFHLALDSENLLELKEVIERAIKKEKALKDLINKKGMIYLGDEK